MRLEMLLLVIFMLIFNDMEQTFVHLSLICWLSCKAAYTRCWVLFLTFYLVLVN